ncbi:penicillin-binding protein activator [Arsenophonus nasoniae]|uniref:penicillin-binding protein activator n=1 Tax=Arsenophonus nasoniae TaxID=638 RepID=UPI00387A627C
MRSSIFVKKSLICIAMLSSLILVGCHSSVDQSKPTADATIQTSSEISHYQSIIDAANGTPSAKALRAYIAQEPLLKDQVSHQKNIDDFWQMLINMPAEQIQKLDVRADENVLQGWVDLLDLYHNNYQDPAALNNAFNDWKIRYPANPGVKTSPTALIQIIHHSSINSNPKIGLFLPLSNNGKIFAEAILQGFLDAQKGLPINQTTTTNSSEQNNQNSDTVQSIIDSITNSSNNIAQENNLQTPSLVIDNAPINNQQVKVYDTNIQSIETLLRQAEQDGITLVVGPLLKPDVLKAIQIDTPLNLLTLNELDPDKMPLKNNVCYFSLLPEDEAINAARHIAKQGKQAPLLLIPASPFGERIANVFAQEWLKLKQTSVRKQTFGDINSLKARTAQSTGIRMIGTPIMLAEQPASNTNDMAEAIDAVYIVATSDELSLIKPMIDMATDSRTRPTLYASSRSHQTGLSTDYYLEMENLQFSEIPLLAAANSALLTQANQRLSADYSLIRLYAMGIDAWLLANHFNQLHQNNIELNGATGKLSVNSDNCVIFRSLPWLKFQQGKVQLL